MKEKKLFKNIVSALLAYQKGNPLKINRQVLDCSWKNIHLKTLLSAIEESDILSIFNKNNRDSLKRWGTVLNKLELPPFGIACVVINQMMEVMNTFENWDLGTSSTFSRLHREFPDISHDILFFVGMLKAGVDPFKFPYSREDMWECIHFCLLFYPEYLEVANDADYLLGFCEYEEHDVQEYLMRRNIFYRLLLQADGLI